MKRAYLYGLLAIWLGSSGTFAQNVPTKEKIVAQIKSHKEYMKANYSKIVGFFTDRYVKKQEKKLRALEDEFRLLKKKGKKLNSKEQARLKFLQTEVSLLYILADYPKPLSDYYKALYKTKDKKLAEKSISKMADLESKYAELISKSSAEKRAFPDYEVDFYRRQQKK